MKDSNSTETTQYIVPCEKDSNSLFHNMAASNLNTLLYICSPKCDFLFISDICKECSTIKPVKKSQAQTDFSAKAKTPISEIHPNRILLALQEEQKQQKNWKI